MDYRKTAQEIYDHIGKKENIISAAHCATRLRLVISDNSKADKEYVENIEGVKGVFFAQGQMQIILGTSCGFQGKSGTETDQDTWRYFCADYSCNCCKRFPDGNYGSTELHGKQWIFEY